MYFYFFLMYVIYFLAFPYMWLLGEITSVERPEIIINN